MSPDNTPFPQPPVLPTDPENKILSPNQFVVKTDEPPVPAPSGEKEKAFWAFTKDTDSDKKTVLGMHVITAATGWLIFAIIGIIFFSLAKINTWWATDSINYKTTVEMYKNMVMYVDSLIGYPGIAQYQNLQNVTSVSQTDEIINSPIPFMFKRDVMMSAMEQIKLTILTNNKESQNLAQEITKYGFIHPDMMALMETSKDKIPIMVSLHTLETVKFGTALKLFSMLDTFLQQASQVLGINKDAVEDIIATYVDNGEAYISNYLSMCYLNPYERLPDCNQINDFENYFTYENPGASVDNKLLSQLLELVESRLETSSVASIKMNFNRFDPNAKNLAFEVTISTLAEDEAAFVTRGVLNPHVFILSTLVNLLKQSLFVIGDSISVQNITVRDQNVTIGNVQIPVKTSTISFDLPLQNSSQREIFDFLDTNKY